MEHKYFLIIFDYFFGLLLMVQAFAQVISFIVYDSWNDSWGIRLRNKLEKQFSGTKLDLLDLPDAFSTSRLLPFFITDNFIKTYKSLILLTTVPTVYVLYRIILNISLRLTID